MPQAGQNRASAGISAPHTGHAGTSEDPHATQNRAPSGFCVPQFAQVVTAASLSSAHDGTPEDREPVDSGA